MVDLKPSLSGYARIAYARELLGRPRQALEAMELALDSSGNVPEPTAWTLVEIGKLHFSLGELASARQAFRAALARRARLPVRARRARESRGRPRPHCGRGAPGVAGRRGRAAAAVRRARSRDLYAVRGEKARAREQFELIGVIERLQAANGVNSDLELALFRIDHGIRLGETLELARKARAARPSVHGDDVLAWALARNGRCAEALAYSKRSLRLGTRDASFYFHRGMIERCLGRDAGARRWFRLALDTNPHFSLLWSPTARRYAS